jgi:hypothetical protein
MKAINFKISVVAMAIGMFALTSCGGGGSKKQSGSATSETKTEQAAPSKGTTLKELNDNNWQAVVKANFGLDLAVPAGGEFKKVESPNGVNNLILTMTIGEKGVTGEAEAEGKRLFEATKAISKHGNYKNNPNWEAETVSAGDAINDFSELGGVYPDGDVITNWAYTFNSKMIMVNYFTRGNQAQYSFTINKTIK